MDLGKFGLLKVIKDGQLMKEQDEPENLASIDLKEENVVTMEKPILMNKKRDPFGKCRTHLLQLEFVVALPFQGYFFTYYV